MNIIASFDLPYLARQSALVALFPALPLLLLGVVGSTLRLRVICAASMLVCFLAIFGGFLWNNATVWRNSPLPYTPFKVGPSCYTILDSLPVLALTLWLPALLIIGAARVILRLVRLQEAVPATMRYLAILFATAGTFWTWAMFAAPEYSHEDTVWAEGFTAAKWESVGDGMTRAEVEQILGPPLPGLGGTSYDNPDETAAAWARNWSAGYSAVVWFRDGAVVRKTFWYQD